MHVAAVLSAVTVVAGCGGSPAPPAARPAGSLSGTAIERTVVRSDAAARGVVPGTVRDRFARGETQLAPRELRETASRWGGEVPRVVGSATRVGHVWFGPLIPARGRRTALRMCAMTRAVAGAAAIGCRSLRDDDEPFVNVIYLGGDPRGPRSNGVLGVVPYGVGEVRVVGHDRRHGVRVVPDRNGVFGVAMPTSGVGRLVYELDGRRRSVRLTSPLAEQR